MSKKISAVDSVLEQCTWVSAFTNHGVRTLCFNMKTGVVLYQKEEVGKPFNHKNISVTGTSEEIYKKYLDTIEVPKEKAFVNNKRDGMFGTHRLMRQRYSANGGEAMRKIEKKYPEYFI